ncbi:MAG TPA: glycerol-3-phosphate 1-O-acyltransferase PlsY [Candidatus Mediterraneibacter stercorigallinarum]|uniref:Glycerol-3-phosphate acyltransferase n=1 Tax=Candidatus Mediterraneibacter stercorigallinarum TaxID=2838686 RepID=A0A9D2DB28_9FIRM|nr:glycerol-3-phosphate 1-O-acyltransferase PlsY [Candidatus Mediterraneibacter stercorigallinarum]
MERLICLAVGYVCGLFQTGYLVGKMNHMDIRKKGSGNAGTTNALRVLGWKAGVITFFGDVLKCVAAFLVTYFMYRGSDVMPLLAMYAGAGVTLGHNFPFYMNFKGGKGIAVMAGLVVVNSFWHLPASLLLIPITLACFLVPVVVTRYISVGSLAAYTVFWIEMVMIGRMGWFQMETARCYELYIVLFLLTALAWYRHRQNLKRLANGTENKFGAKKKTEKE